MSKTITITNLNGTEPYDVYICSNTYTGCVYINTINDVNIPYTFLVPSIFENLSNVGVKVIDDNKCEIKDTVNL